MTGSTQISPLSLHAALLILCVCVCVCVCVCMCVCVCVCVCALVKPHGLADKMIASVHKIRNCIRMLMVLCRNMVCVCVCVCRRVIYPHGSRTRCLYMCTREETLSEC